MNFAQLALCSDEKLSDVCEMMSQKQKKQWATWQLVNSLGLPQPSFETLENHEQNLVRTINLPLDT